MHKKHKTKPHRQREPHITIKTPEQIEGIRKSCRLAAETLQFLEPLVIPEVTTDELCRQADTFIRDHGAIPACLNYGGFPREVCISLNEVICHGIPSDRRLREGDIVNIDVTTILEGYFGDTCRMYSVGVITTEAQRLLNISKECLYLGLQQVRPGNRYGNIGYHIANYALAQGYSVVYQFCGHGTGIKFHEEPQIAHIAKRDSGPIMRPGHIFTIEPMINQGLASAIIREDGWTAETSDGKLSAQFEHTVLVTHLGVEVLTDLSGVLSYANTTLSDQHHAG